MRNPSRASRLYQLQSLKQKPREMYAILLLPLSNKRASQRDQKVRYLARTSRLYRLQNRQQKACKKSH